MSAEATELAPPPSASEADNDRLTSAFDAALAKQNAPVEEASKEVAKPVVEETKGDVPAELLQEKKDTVEEPLVSEEAKAKLKGAARENFDKLEKAAQGKIDALRKELAEIKSKVSSPTDVEPILAEAKAAKERADKLESEFERAHYTSSPRYQQFAAKEQAELKAAKSYLEGGEVNPAILDAAANTSGSARLKVLLDAGIDANTISILSPHLANIDSTRRERDSSLEGWKASMEQDRLAQQNYQKQQEAQVVANEKKVFDEVMSKMVALPAFTKVDGNEDWNKSVEQRTKDAEEYFHGRKPLHELVEITARGVAQKVTEQMNVQLTKRCNDLASENARLKAAQPSNGNGSEVVTKAVVSKDPMDELKANFERAQEKVKSEGSYLRQ